MTHGISGESANLVEILARRIFERPPRALMDADLADALIAARRAGTEPVVVASAAGQAAPAAVASTQVATQSETRQQQERSTERPAVEPTEGIDVTV